MNERADTLGQALAVAAISWAVWYWVGTGSGDASIISFFAFVIGSISLIVAGFCILAWIFGGIATLTEDWRYQIENKARERRSRVYAAQETARQAKLEASRERHRANRALWLHTARQNIARQPPDWDSGSLAAFNWLYTRMGKTVMIRTRQEQWEGTQYGERNYSSMELKDAGEWTSRPWVVNLPDDSFAPKEYDDRVDESVVTVRWEIAGAATLPSGGITVDTTGIEIRTSGRSWSQVNDYDHGSYGESVGVVRIEDAP